MRRGAALAGGALLLGLLALAAAAPERLPDPDPARASLGPAAAPPFGTDPRGRPLWAYAAQGAAVVVLPSVAAGALVAGSAAGAGLVRCAGLPRLDGALAALAEVVGSLPRLPMVLVVALVLPADARSLWPLAAAWAALASPGAMDEAAAAAERVGGSRFVEALRAHGFSWSRVYLWHVLALNLRPVLVRQGAETAAAVTFLEVAISWLAAREDHPSLAHPERVRSWAALLDMGYPSLLLDVPTGHALGLGLGLCGVVLGAARLLAAGAAAR